MSSLSKKDILHIAQLSRLHLPEGKFDHLLKQFNDIVGYVEQLKKLDTTGIEPTTQVIGTPGTGTPFRKDEPGACFSKETVVANAPDKQDQFFKVPRMIGEEEP